MNDIERIEQNWDDKYDGQFFRITSYCFSHSFCTGASVLLASYDSDDEFRPVYEVGGTQPRPRPENALIVHLSI